MSRNFQHFVGASEEPEVSILIFQRVIAWIVVAWKTGPVDVLVSFWITVQCHEHSWPWTTNNQVTLVTWREGISMFVDDVRVNTRQWICCRAWFQGDEPYFGAGRDHYAARLGLPPSIDDRTATLTDQLIVPVPGGWVDWFTDCSKNSQRL